MAVAVTTGAVDDRAALSLVSVYEISKILTSPADLQARLRAVLNLLASYMEMRRGIVAIADRRRALPGASGAGASGAGTPGALKVVAAAGLSSAAVNDGRADLPAEIAARIVAGQAPFVTENVAEDPLLARYVRVPSVLDDETVSFIAVPIKTFGRPFGCLAIARVWRLKTQVNVGDDLRFLTMVANLIAQTVCLDEQSIAIGATDYDDRPRGARAEGPPSTERPAPPPREVPMPGEPIYRLDNVIGASRAMQQVFSQVHLVAPTRSTVVLRGESGTGKEMIAQALHVLSGRGDRPFVKVNCAALPDTLLESELFGHEKGAFTGATQQRKGRFELAHGGTLFLDEIGDISRAFQAKLLRALQEREFERIGGTATIRVDVRIVCATNRNLEEAVARGDFRADLYYRINVVPIFIPPLRDRRDDIPALADHFLSAFNRENDRRLSFSDRAMQAIQACNYPGNVRELENCIYRVATMARTPRIDRFDLPCQSGICHCASLLPGTAFGVDPVPPPDAPPPPPADRRDDPDTLADLPQRERLLRVMERSGWVQAKAARVLGLTPRQIGYALRKHNIEIKRL